MHNLYVHNDWSEEIFDRPSRRRRQNNFAQLLFLEGTCDGRRGRGRPRRRWTQDIGEWMGVSTVEAGRQALERGEFCHAVWEATSIKDPP